MCAVGESYIVSTVLSQCGKFYKDIHMNGIYNFSFKNGVLKLLRKNLVGLPLDSMFLSSS